VGQTSSGAWRGGALHRERTASGAWREGALHRDREALESSREAAREELSIFYRLKGVPEADANAIVEYLAANPDQFLKTMAAEKLNLTEEALPNPRRLSPAIGAFVPIIPFFFVSGIPAVVTRPSRWKECRSRRPKRCASHGVTFNLPYGPGAVNPERGLP